MNPQFLQNISIFGDFIQSEQDFGIVIGNHQNIDTVAAALSLYLSLKQAQKNVQIVSLREPLVEVSNLVGVNKIEKDFKGDTTKLVVALPYIKGEVEKVLFTEQENTINFHLTAAEGRTITPFELDQVKLNWEGGAPKNIITVGIGNITEIDGVIDSANSKIVNIDNFSGNGRFGDIVVVEDSLSSLSEIIGKLIKEQKLPFDQDMAQNILDGVLFATRNFTKSNTTPLAFEAASSAMYLGAKRKDEGSNRDQGRDNRDQSRPQQPRSQRPNNDFPAMHMQGRDSQNQRQGQDNRRMNNPSRSSQYNPQGNPSQPFQNRNVTDIRNKIMEQTRSQVPFQAANEDAQDAQIFEEPKVNQPVEDMQAPQDSGFSAPTNEDVPDDWLMPKVFKSSKNNN